ncbi:MAG: translation elongation factor Ts [bacterium]
MVEITAAMVKELREKSGAGFTDCKKALVEKDGDIKKSMEYLREKGIADASKKSSRATNQGLVYSYIHTTGRVGTLIELNCETDFVARTDDFQLLAKEISLQIAGMKPSYLKREDVPVEVVEKEKEIYRAQMKDAGKPAQVVDKIVEGKLDKFYKEFCLLEMAWFKDDKKNIETLIKESIAKIGENITLKRFVRFELGEN